MTIDIIIIAIHRIKLQLTLVTSTSLISNNRLSRSENLVLFYHGNLTTANKILWKREEIAPKRSNFSSFPQYFQYISNFVSQITYTFVKCSCSIYSVLNSANLICQSTDISKYIRESLELRDNKSRLYLNCHFFCNTFHVDKRVSYL